MALIPIMGQPVNLVPNNERAFGCEPENGYCVLYGQDEATDTDPAEAIMFEMRQTPCGATIVSNGTFADGSDWTADANVVIAQNKATHVVGTSGEITQALTVTIGNYYQIEVTVTGMSAGTIDIYFTQAGTPSYTISENGVYTIYLYDIGDNDDIAFVFSADCDAAISNVAVYKLLNTTEIIATLNTIDGVFVANMTIDLFDDYVLASVDTYTLSEGCYSIVVIDPCESASYAGLTEVFVDGVFDDAGEWTVAADVGVAPTISGGLFNIPADYFYKESTAIQAFNIPTNVKLFAIGEIETGNMFTGGIVEFSTDLVNGLIQFGQMGGIELMSNLTYTKTFIINALDVSTLDQIVKHTASTGGFPSVEPNPFYFPGDNNEIKRVSLRVAPFSEVTGIFTSNCIKVSADVSGTRKVEGFAELLDESSNPIKGRSLGFLFVDDYFWLRARLGVQFSNPHTPTSTDNNLSSNGRTKKAYAQLSKAWDLTFHAVDENMHDTIANIINCDSFQIEGNEYVTDEKEYTANYGENGINAVAESTIEVQKVDGTRFNTNQ